MLPEALERWSLAVFGKVLPRHLEIIYEINAHFLEEVRIRFMGDEARIARLSLIDESGERYVRMAHLACVGSHAINGVAELHSELLKRDVLQGFLRAVAAEVQQQDQRRDAAALDGAVQSEALRARHRAHRRRLDQGLWRSSNGSSRSPTMRIFAPAGAPSSFSTSATFAALALARTGIVTDPDSMFDVLVKRIHEYKRQHLKVLHIVSLYHAIKSNPSLAVQPRTFIFGGKAAPGYHLAKLMIKLITAVGDVVNRDPDVRDRLKVVFLPNFNVTNGQRVYPAADLSEQISTAGKEASGTGNMKFSMNGALTIGTLDGANIEIREEVGADNFFLFGLSTEEVYAAKAHGYKPMDHYYANQGLRDVIDLIRTGFFSRGDTELFRPLIDGLMYEDPYLLFADFQSYVECQKRVDDAYRDTERWTRMSILNAARSGKFSSDRTIREYCKDIWHVEPVAINLLTHAQAGNA